MRGSELRAALFEVAFAVACYKPFHRFNEQWQRGFAVSFDGNIRFVELQIIGVVALCEEIVSGNADPLVTGTIRTHAREIDDFDSEQNVRICRSHAAACLLERMPVREVHSSLAIDDSRLQRFRKLDEMLDGLGRARHTIHHDDRVLCRNEQLRDFVDSRRIGSRGYERPHFRNVQVGIARHFFFLQIDVENDRGRHHRRGHRDLVCAHHRLGKV